MEINSRISGWEQVYQKHKQNQLINPFSLWEGASHRQALDRSHKEYGQPVLGSMTELRGKEACQIISEETKVLVNFIKKFGHRSGRDCVMITFGELFEGYKRISNKLVGLLLRARRCGLVAFEGEILLQRKDDTTPIYLVTPISKSKN